MKPTLPPASRYVSSNRPEPEPLIPCFPDQDDLVRGLRLIRLLGETSASRVYLTTGGNLSERSVVLKISREPSSGQFRTLPLHPNLLPTLAAWTDLLTGLNYRVMPWPGTTSLADLTRELWNGSGAERAKEKGLIPRLLCDLLPTNEDATQRFQIPAVLLRLGFTDGLIWLMIPVAKALECLHEQKQSHGNLKLSNILLSPETRPILTDAAGDNSLSPHDDIRTFGLMLYHMLTGNAISGVAQMPTRHRMIPMPLLRFLKRCLSDDFAARPQATELARELEQGFTKKVRLRAWQPEEG